MKKVLILFGVVAAIVLFFIFKGSSTQTYNSGSLFAPLFSPKETKILFVGDMMFDRYVRQVMDKKGGDFVFSCKDSNETSLSDFLKNYDLVVGNLEGPITDNPSISLGTEPGSPDNYVFTFPPSIAELLAQNNIKIVDLGNNHIGNFGEEGISSTKKYLDKAGINYFIGDTIYRTEIGGTKISFISYNEFGGNSPEKVAQKISDEKLTGQIVFIYAHWGDEYSEIPQRIKDIANLFAKSGTDFIIGSHPHIILPSEKIGNTVVYYSLGNFIFDQYWDGNVSTGLVLELNIKDSQTQIIEHRVSLLSDGKTCLVN